jgi:alpha-tubulin suppressor-like RCC1 family protein
MCWGGNKIGQIGNGFLSASVPLPTVPSFPQLTPPVARIVSFSLGYYHTCAIDAHSRMFCWGDGGFGRLGPNCSMGDDDFNWIRLVSSARL